MENLVTHPARAAGSWKGLAISLGLAFLVAGSAWWATMYRPMEIGKDAVRELLRDPQSAQFRSVRLTSDGKVCGEVNARNATGGYTGFRTFVAYKQGSSDVTAVLDATASEPQPEGDQFRFGTHAVSCM